MLVNIIDPIILLYFVVPAVFRSISLSYDISEHCVYLYLSSMCETLCSVGMLSPLPKY